MTNKEIAELHFHQQALEETIEQIKPALRVASEAAHKCRSDDRDDSDRLMAIGYLVDALQFLCYPRVSLLVDLAYALVELDHEEEEGVSRPAPIPAQH